MQISHLTFKYFQMLFIFPTIRFRSVCLYCALKCLNSALLNFSLRDCGLFPTAAEWSVQ